MEIALSDRAIPYEDIPAMTDRAIGLEFLKQYAKKKAAQKESRDLADLAPGELYDFKDRLKRQRVMGRGPDAAHQRWYKKEMLKRINAELRRRKLPATRPDDSRVYGPGGAKWQQAGVREAA